MYLLLISVAMIVWGFWKGPLFNIDHYVTPEPSFVHPTMFVGTALSTAFGLLGLILYFFAVPAVR